IDSTHVRKLVRVSFQKQRRVELKRSRWCALLGLVGLGKPLQTRLESIKDSCTKVLSGWGARCGAPLMIKLMPQPRYCLVSSR
ncbi:hypothetical protein GW17_00048677, partial [Ensete ventricosum]